MDFPPLWSDPKPVQRPHPPVLIAGELERAPERIAEYGDGWIPRFVHVTPEEITATRRRIEAMYRDSGRDFSKFRITMFGAHPDRETHRRLEDAGVDRVLQVLRISPEEDALARIEGLGGTPARGLTARYPGLDRWTEEPAGRWQSGDPAGAREWNLLPQERSRRS